VKELILRKKSVRSAGRGKSIGCGYGVAGKERGRRSSRACRSRRAAGLPYRKGNKTRPPDGWEELAVFVCRGGGLRHTGGHRDDGTYTRVSAPEKGVWGPWWPGETPFLICFLSKGGWVSRESVPQGGRNSAPRLLMAMGFSGGWVRPHKREGGTYWPVDSRLTSRDFVRYSWGKKKKKASPTSFAPR